jgi:GNAT superfamily N-acetyltransferase
LLIRRVRDGEWDACLTIDLSYETEYAWQMDTTERSEEWGISFRKVHLPRRLRMEHPIPESCRIQHWSASDQCWIAVEHREVIGLIAVSLDLVDHQARISDLGVAFEDRRQGVGTALLERAMEWCNRYRIPQLVLPCPLKAEPAIQFALHHRFNFGGFQDHYWPGHEVALLFYQRLRG